MIPKPEEVLDNIAVKMGIKTGRLLLGI